MKGDALVQIAKAVNVDLELSLKNVVAVKVLEFKIFGKVCLLCKCHVDLVAGPDKRLSIFVDHAMVLEYKKRRRNKKLAFQEE